MLISFKKKINELLISSNNKLLDTQEVKNLIKHFRKKKGWSTEKLAELVGTSPQQINFLENGKRRLTQDWMNRIANALGLSHASLLLPGAEAQHFQDLDDVEEQIVQLFRALDPGDRKQLLRMLRTFEDRPLATPHLQHIETLQGGGEKKSPAKNKRSKTGT